MKLLVFRPQRRAAQRQSLRVKLCMENFGVDAVKA